MTTLNSTLSYVVGTFVVILIFGLYRVGEISLDTACICAVLHIIIVQLSCFEEKEIK